MTGKTGDRDQGTGVRKDEAGVSGGIGEGEMRVAAPAASLGPSAERKRPADAAFCGTAEAVPLTKTVFFSTL